MTDNQLKAFINEVEKRTDLKRKFESTHSYLFILADEEGFKITQNDAKCFINDMKPITTQYEKKICHP